MPERRPMVLEPLRRTAEDARGFAFVAHHAQRDQAGEPYVEHVFRVATAVGRMMFQRGHATNSRQLDEAVQIAALHDVVEDTEYTADDLLAEGFACHVVDGVKLLSRPKACSLSYLEWIEYIATLGEIPEILVKIADIEDNSDPARLALLPAETRARLEKKYGAALPVLKAAAEQLGWKEVRDV